jgi:hypothetical protein
MKKLLTMAAAVGFATVSMAVAAPSYAAGPILKPILSRDGPRPTTPPPPRSPH